MIFFLIIKIFFIVNIYFFSLTEGFGPMIFPFHSSLHFRIIFSMSSWTLSLLFIKRSYNNIHTNLGSILKKHMIVWTCSFYILLPYVMSNLYPTFLRIVEYIALIRLVGAIKIIILGSWCVWVGHVNHPHG